MTARLQDEQDRILSYWWLLELFSPQQVPSRPRKANQPAHHRTVEWKPGTPLPWDELPQPRPTSKGKRREWRHTVYLGVYQLSATYDLLGQVFGEDPDAAEKRPKTESACAGIVVDEGGRALVDSAILSSAAWAVGRANNPGPADPAWMEGFPTAAEEFIEKVDEFEGARRNLINAESQLPQDDESLQQLLKVVHAAAGVKGMDTVGTARIVVDSWVVVASDSDDAPETDFLNSFYLDDLVAVRSAIGHGDLGDGLSTYLTGDAMLALQSRIDIRDNPDHVDAGAGIDRLPKGRWPTNPEHPLALSQQFAVNYALNDLASRTGIVGVNGPPGTGKTTMLRDILAGNVVERAHRLAALPRPEDAFSSEPLVWKDGQGYPRKLPQLLPELTGFEMVVASANNAAVENITVEVPAREAIDPPWQSHADYFAGIASRVLGLASDAPVDAVKVNEEDDASDHEAPTAAWGLVAARLGRKRNRSQFRQEFWYGESDPKTHKSIDGGVPGIWKQLEQWRDGIDEHRTWEEARARFAAAEQRVDTLIRARRDAQVRLHELRRLTKREGPAAADLQHQRAVLAGIGHDLDQQMQVEQQTSATLERAADAHARHLAAKPSWLETVFSLGRAPREWRAQLAGPATQLHAAEQTHDATVSRREQITQALDEQQHSVHATETEVARIRAGITRLRVTCAQDGEEFGAAYPGDRWIGDERQLHAPWLDNILNTARSELFLAALDLHRDFLATVDPKTIIDGLRAASDIIAGTYPHDLPAEKVRAGWQLFFLVVPLVSTTFASASRMFGPVGSEAIGWLLIDEAGQAPPQYAVGAIWRSKRVVAVGDPMQLEPVVTIPATTQLNIAQHYGVSATWQPPRASVQTLADRVTLAGTMLQQGEEPRWVSAPLLVHRRCDNPMFDLCNAIAYDDMMVNGVNRPKDPEKPDPYEADREDSVFPSRWFHEAAPTRGMHLQDTQIQRFHGAMAYLEKVGVKPTDVIVISPFRVVADRLRGLIDTYPGLRAGTIHTAQGREAPVVILVLGGDPDMPGTPGVWAQTPNLVNVAASRAQRRLYVIGDRDYWAAHKHFSDLARALPVAGNRDR